ncbi:DoxX family protein [Tianweitania sp. BSSL-BM11]|uniref:DoxX family protein n=1 Tax=Tianweitania aestuarii TaxID=2814886 RepID=A0ABS5RVI6_9HYPH|nr:DoxX family protein [Tianweitania aestuarii]MBS9720997.1 DoxX family protein [Tianweitania aestuarii]
MKYVYYLATVVITAFYAHSVYGYATDPAFWAGEYAKVGFPTYLVDVMLVVKALGVIAVWVRRPVALAQLAYAGFFYHTLLACMADLAVGSPVGAIAAVLFVLVVVSWATQNYARSPAAAYAPGGSIMIKNLA